MCVCVHMKYNQLFYLFSLKIPFLSITDDGFFYITGQNNYLDLSDFLEKFIFRLLLVFLLNAVNFK